MVKTRSGIIRQAIGPVRGRLINNDNTATDLLAWVVTNNDVECQTKLEDISEVSDKIKSNISTLNEKDKLWRDLILGLVDDETIAEEEKLYSETALDPDDGYLTELEQGKELLCKLDRKTREIKRHLDQSSTPNVGRDDPSSQVSPNPQQRRDRVTAKLPKLSLPTFSGNYCDWPQFWSIFKTNVHDRDLAPSEKFAYLIGQLSGTATTTIEGILVNDSNYQHAIDLLRVRFERSDTQMIGTLYSQLKKLPVSTNRVSDLMSTFDRCERIFRQLEAVGENTDANRSLVLDVLSKYPGDVLKELMERFNVGPHSSVSEVRTALQKYIRQSECLSEVLEDLTPFVSKDSVKAGKSSKNPPCNPHSEVESEGQKSFVQTSAFAAPSTRVMGGVSGDAASVAPKTACYFCDGMHFNSKCDKYKTAQQRIDRVRSIRRCFRCLSAADVGEACKAPDPKVRCFFCKSFGQHVSPLCPEQFKNEVSTGSDSTSLLNVNEQALLLTASTVAHNPRNQKHIKVRLLFDSGSHRSYITNACARTLNLRELREDALRVAVFGTERSFEMASYQVQLQVRERDGSMRDLHLHTTPIITGCTINTANIPTVDRTMIREMQYELADDVNRAEVGSVDILIGSDYFWDFILGSKITTPSGLFLIQTTLGYLVAGRHAEGVSDDSEMPALLCLTETLTKLPCESGLMALKSRAEPAVPDLDEYWCLERIGIVDDPIVNDDDEALSSFNESVQFKDGRYHVQWPWKKNIGDLPDNFELSLGRFNGLARRLKSTPEVLVKYNDVIQDQLRRGIIERVPEKFGDFGACPNRVHYLPHHPVIKLSSATTKLRVVYDASAKRSKHSLSLNECLHRGRVLLPDLCHILIRFRLNLIGIVADIEKAFLQVSLQCCDRDVTRFIWFTNGSTPLVNGNLSTFRFCRVPFGVISSGFLLGATVHFHLKAENSPIAKKMDENMYVDNVMSGTNTVSEACDFYDSAKKIFASAGMNLTEWASNSKQFLSTVEQEDLAKSGDTKVLGMIWDTNDDTLRLKSVADLSATTKRQVLQTIASVYDPLGIFQPILLKAKLFLRDLWDLNQSWDEPVSSAFKERWDQIRAEIAPVFTFRITRTPIAVQPSDEVSVVVFSDASSKAYATAVYLRCRNTGAEEWSSHLVYSKSRLTPKKAAKPDVTLPRLELLGLLIGARAGHFVREALLGFQSVPIYLFTDSMCVLHWSNSAKPLSVFVENRIREIDRLNINQIRYVSTDDNRADVATRGSNAELLAKNSLWWRGPSWLSCSIDDWPTHATSTVPDRVEQAVESEVRKGVSTAVAGFNGRVEVVALAAGEDPNNDVAKVLGIDVTRFSSLRKLFRVTALCMKFITVKIWQRISNNFKTSVDAEVRHIFDGISPDATIAVRDLQICRRVWIRAVQRCRYSGVVDALQRNKRHHLIRQLGVKLDDDGVLRCHGRLEHADLGSYAIAPILLPSVSPLTDLVVRAVHERILHAGVSHSLSQVRQAFWVPRGRSVVKKVLRRCVMCKRNNGPPFALPDMPPWPRQRVARSSPFQHTGLDYFGPITVVVGENRQKMWVCLLTCLAVRAVHLEVVADCSAEAFLRALTRFIARRGTPHQIISDNAPQFRVTKTVLDNVWHEVLTDDSVRSYVSNEGIQWKFTTELSPWQGGFYERLVGVVKRSLRVGVGRTLLSWEQLITMVTEVEAIVNSRPITYVYSDFPSATTLRPIDFITELATGLPSMDPTLRPQGVGDAGRDFVRYWKYKQKRLDQLWQFWYDEYLLSLRERGQRGHKNSKGSLKFVPYVNEVLLLKNNELPRGAWKLARVTKVIHSDDGQVRSCELILPNGVTVKRPVSHLYRLELDTAITETGNNQNNLRNESDEEAEFEGFTELEANEAATRVERFRDATLLTLVSNLAVNAYTVCFPK